MRRSDADRQLQRAWRKPRLWERFRAPDPERWLVWNTRRSLVAGVIALGLGVALVLRHRYPVAGAVLAAVGLVVAVAAVAGLRRSRRRRRRR